MPHKDDGWYAPRLSPLKQRHISAYEDFLRFNPGNKLLPNWKSSGSPDSTVVWQMRVPAWTIGGGLLP